MYTDVDDMFPDTDSYQFAPSYLGGECVGDEDLETLREIELMGIDVNDEEFLMSGPFKKLFRRIRKRVRKRRESRAKEQAQKELGPSSSTVTAGPSFQLSTTEGQFGYGPGGFTYQKGMPAIPQSLPPAPRQSAGFLQNPMAAIQQNPMLLAIPLGLLAIMLLKK